MDREAPRPYLFDDLVEADLPTVEPFRRDPGIQITVDDAKENCLEQWSVVSIKRTVDKYAAIVVRGCDVPYPLGGCGSRP